MKFPKPIRGFIEAHQELKAEDEILLAKARQDRETREGILKKEVEEHLGQVATPEGLVHVGDSREAHVQALRDTDEHFAVTPEALAEEAQRQVGNIEQPPSSERPRNAA